MKISEYQQWLKAYDEARGWDRVSAGHTFVHLIEELGEVARLVLYSEGYRDAAEKPNLRHELAEELADAANFLFKLAYQFDIDLEAALAGNQRKAESRYDVDWGRRETERYITCQEENLRKIRGEA
jgi:NTP pyrophosphatase (non-canonical NTP hydrolase)